MKGSITKIKSGFTLVEVIIATILGVTAVGLVLTSFWQLSMTAASGKAYRDMHQDLRHALDIISRDVHAASGVVACSSNQYINLTVVRPSGSETVWYYLYNNNLYRITALGTWSILATGITSVDFDLYTREGASTTVGSDAYVVEILLTASSTVIRHTYTDSLCMRVLMRNK